jgi:hypothetical protein
VRHRDYHQALLTGCGNRRLESVATSLRDSMRAFATDPGLPPGR